MSASSGCVRGSSVCMGMGFVPLIGLDVALWDIRGKAETLPIYKLLGEALGAKVDVYESVLRLVRDVPYPTQ